MKDKSLSPELDTIEFHDDADERMKRAVKVIVAHKPAQALTTKPVRREAKKQKA